MSICPICHGTDSELMYQHDNIPVFANKVYRSEAAAEQVLLGKEAWWCCHRCGFVYNGAFEADKLIYNNEYDNSQNYSEVFKAHMNDVEAFIVSEIDLNQKVVLEVGCGKGAFLNQLNEHHPCTVIGFDPSYEGDCYCDGGQARFFKEKFDQASRLKIHTPVDLVIWRHVIEHTQNPRQDLENIMNVIKQHEQKDFLLYIETPDVEWIWKNHMIYDCGYEHCSLFSLTSLQNLLNMAGLTIKKWKRSFRGQYLSILAQPAEHRISLETPKYMLEADWQKGINAAVEKYLTKYKGLDNQQICVWGAGAKGTMFCNLFDPLKRYISCVVDINPNKWNTYIAKTAHQIVSPESLSDYGITIVLVLNSNYFAEIEQEAKKHSNKDIVVLDFEAWLKGGLLEIEAGGNL